MTQKIIIAKDGFNALTETNIDNLIYSSDYDTLKYHASGQAQVSVSGAPAETTVAHGLGYAPFFIAYVDTFSPSGYSQVPGDFISFSYTIANVYADSTNLTFRVDTDLATPRTFTFQYKIFRNRLGI